MNVNELIEKLNTLPPDTKVKVWDAYKDIETSDVFVSTDNDGTVWIMDTIIGYSPL